MHTCVLVVTHNMDAWWSHMGSGLKGLHTDSKTSIFHPNNELTEHETTRDQPICRTAFFKFEPRHSHRADDGNHDATYN